MTNGQKTAHKRAQAKTRNFWGNAVCWGLIFIFWVCCFVGLSNTEASAAKASVRFVGDVSIGNEFEIESSRLALVKSQDDSVKAFAQKMIDDHTQAAEDLRAAVAAAPETKTQTPDTYLDAKHQKLMDELKSASEKDFDKLYIKDQIDAHRDAVKLFRDYAKNGDNSTLKTFALTSLPMLQEHKHDIFELKSSI